MDIRGKSAFKVKRHVKVLGGPFFFRFTLHMQKTSQICSIATLPKTHSPGVFSVMFYHGIDIRLTVIDKVDFHILRNLGPSQLKSTNTFHAALFSVITKYFVYKHILLFITYLIELYYYNISIH